MCVPVTDSVTFTEAVPEESATGLPSATPSTLKLTVPVGAGEDDEVTLTANFTAVPDLTEKPEVGEVMASVGVGSVPLTASCTVFEFVTVLSRRMRVALRAPAAVGLVEMPI